MTWRNRVLVGDVREQLATLPDESVHCVVTSPPYWGLRDYGADGQLGLERTPEEYVCNMVDVFRDVRRVLRKDGTVWLNLGDCYAGSGRGMNGDGSQGKAGPMQSANVGSLLDMHDKRVEAGVIGRYWTPAPQGLKQKDLVGQPWRVAFALQADGWWLRSDIIWSKPNPMPESVTDRPTKSHEYLFLLTKSATYYYDAEAIREPLAESSIQRISQPTFASQTCGAKDYGPDSNRSMRKTLENFADRVMTASHDAETASLYEEGSNGSRLSLLRQAARAQGGEYGNPSGRNRRTVWEIPTQPFPEAHFATYPEALVLPCIQAGTSEHGVCSVCGAPWRRIVEREPLTDETKAAFEAGRNRNAEESGRNDGYAAYKPHQERAVLSTRWEPTCKHEAPLARAVILDPFMGSGTTGLVAYNAGRDFVGVELNPTYAAMAERRIGADRGRLL